VTDTGTARILSTFETRMPADVRDEYDPAQDRAIVDDTIFDQRSRTDTEEAFQVGDLVG
jgi:hypothetical protein